MKFTHLLVAATAIVATVSHTAAQTGSMSIVVAYPAGGPADAAARAIQPALQSSLGATVIVENVPGAGGSLGAQKVLNANANGQHALLATIGETMLTPMALALAKYKGEDFRLVAPLSRSQFILVARPNIAVRTLDELIAKSKSQTLTYASLGQGSIYHLVMEDLKGRTGLDATHVPYKGGAQIVTDLAGDHVDVAFLPLAGNTVAMVTQGKLTALAVTGKARSTSLPNVPTFQEVKVMDFDYSIWAGVFVRRNTPEQQVQQLHAIFSNIKATPGFAKFTADSGAAVFEPLTLQQTDAFYTSEMNRYRAIARSIKLEPS